MNILRLLLLFPFLSLVILSSSPAQTLSRSRLFLFDSSFSYAPSLSRVSFLSFYLSFFLYLPENLSFSLSFYRSPSHSFLFFSRSFYLPTFLPSLFSFYLLNLDFVSLFQINFLSLYLPQSLFFSVSFSFTINLPLPFSLFYPLSSSPEISSSSA